MQTSEDKTEALKQRIDPERVPRHIAIIMDGNGRWAERQGEHRVVGHANGVRSVREALVACREIGVGYLTLYAFSTENWKRPKAEVERSLGTGPHGPHHRPRSESRDPRPRGDH